MAVNTQHFPSLRRDRVRRERLSRYLTFDSSRYLLSLIVLVSLMSLISLGQTGVVATRGYAVADLEAQQTNLLRKRNQLEVRYAAAQSLEHIRTRAEQLGLRPIAQNQIRYLTIASEPSVSPSECLAAEEQNPVSNNPPPCGMQDTDTTSAHRIHPSTLNARR